MVPDSPRTRCVYLFPVIGFCFLTSLQIVVGVAAYGRGFGVASSASTDAGNFPAFDINQTPVGDSDTSSIRKSTFLLLGMERELILMISIASSANSGLFNFAALIKDGYLTEAGEVASGVTYYFHDCSQTVCILRLSEGSISFPV